MRSRSIHKEWSKEGADKEGNQNVKIQEEIIEDEVPRQYLAQYSRKAIKTWRQIKVRQRICKHLYTPGIVYILIKIAIV